MRVLFAVWELDPLFKVGGLGDVARSLPRALNSYGIDIRIVLPFYDAVKLGRNRADKISEFKTSYDSKVQLAEVYRVDPPEVGVPVYLLKNPHFIGHYFFPDTCAFFNLAIVEMVDHNYIDWKPDIIHGNDLHTGLIPYLVKRKNIAVKTLFTIHNLAYQGWTKGKIMAKLGMPKSGKDINFLREGIINSDMVTTVSPTYAKEIKTTKLGCGLNEILKKKGKNLMGIVNGIGKVAKLGSKEEKEEMKEKLQKKLGIIVTDKWPVISFIGRFDPHQKGIELIYEILKKYKGGYEVVVLGTGNRYWEDKFVLLSKFNPEKISCNLRFDPALAEMIYGGSDFIMIPSKYEPCGLIQMIAMAHGTLPVAHKTGGLGDTIKDEVNGILFSEYTVAGLEKGMGRALRLWNEDKEKLRKMINAAVKTDFSWKKSAGEYERLYERLLEVRN